MTFGRGTGVFCWMLRETDCVWFASASELLFNLRSGALLAELSLLDVNIWNRLIKLKRCKRVWKMLPVSCCWLLLLSSDLSSFWEIPIFSGSWPKMFTFLLFLRFSNCPKCLLWGDLSSQSSPQGCRDARVSSKFISLRWECPSVPGATLTCLPLQFWWL